MSDQAIYKTPFKRMSLIISIKILVGLLAICSFSLKRVVAGSLCRKSLVKIMIRRETEAK